MPYFNTYPYCGAHLDPDEKCEECENKNNEEMEEEHGQ